MQNEFQGTNDCPRFVTFQENADFSTIKLFSIFLFILFGLYSGLSMSSAQAATGWQDVSAQVDITTSNPIRSRRSPDAKVTVEVTNTGTELLASPLRLVLSGLTPSSVSLQGATGTTTENDPYLDLSSVAPGSTSGVITLTILGGGRTTFSFTPRVEQEQTEGVMLGVDITVPATLITVGSSPIQVSGAITDPNATLTLNGIPVDHSNNQFSAAVSLEEGHNTIVARAVNAVGNEVTDSIVVSMDTTPPYITVDSPVDGATVSSSRIAVSGLINDIVRGTVSENQANVVVNGISATVANRTYLAEDVPLVEGQNEIIISASDNVGNTAHNSIFISYEPAAPKHIQLAGGQNQSAQISEILPTQLSVRLIDSDGVSPASNKNVIFRVIQGDGVLAPGTENESQAVLVTSDANGIAQAEFKLGLRAGSGNHKVRARAVGFDSEVIFYASASPKSGNKVSVNSGNNQRGAINQPLPHPFTIAVTDEGANVVQGAQVEFKVTQGSGQFQNGLDTIVATTDSDGRASAHMTLGSEAGLDVQRVTATLVGTNFNAGFTASGLVAGDPGQTKITGIVLDNQDTPLPGVTIRVDGTNRQASTDAQGQFTITEVPVGPVHLLADGSTTSAPGEWPTLSYNIVTVAGAVNPLSAPIYMVKLDTNNAALVGSEDVTLTLPEVPGFELKVLANSVTFPDGSREGLISVTPVNASKVPMAPPNGMQPQFIVTIQPAGAMFDPPAPLTLPNVDGHAPGAQVEMYSYDHDLEEFVAIGLGTVSVDGSVVESNVGVGVVKAGWHCGSQPSGQGCTHNCPECASCNAACNCFWDNGLTPTSLTDTPNDCKKPGCDNGPKQVEDSSDKPLPAECKICDGDTPKALTIKVTGPENVLKGTTATYAASSPDGAIPAGALNWTSDETIIGSNTNTTVSVTFNTASTSAADLKNVKATCGGGNDSIDVCVVDSVAGASVTSLANVNYIENIIAPTSGNWGEMTPIAGKELEVDIGVYYDSGSDTWKAKVTKADSTYSIWYRNLAAGTASAANATAANCTKMIADLTALGATGPGSWYVTSAVEAHERVHVLEWKTSLNPKFTTMKATIEGLTVPHVCGKAAATAKTEIKALASYSTAVTKAKNDAGTVFWAIPDPNANTNAAENGVVNPIIAAIKAKGALNPAWPAACK